MCILVNLIFVFLKIKINSYSVDKEGNIFEIFNLLCYDYCSFVGTLLTILLTLSLIMWLIVVCFSLGWLVCCSY